MITITDAASNKIRQHLEKKQNSCGVRLGVKTTGCNGLTYKLEFVDSTNIVSTDTEIKLNGYSIYIDSDSIPFLKGLIMDYQNNKLSEKFIFNNPNEKSKCGCGSSFNV